MDASIREEATGQTARHLRVSKAEGGGCLGPKSAHSERELDNRKVRREWQVLVQCAAREVMDRKTNSGVILNGQCKGIEERRLRPPRGLKPKVSKEELLNYFILTLKLLK